MVSKVCIGIFDFEMSYKIKAREDGRKKHKQTLNFIKMFGFGNFWRLYAGGFCTP